MKLENRLSGKTALITGATSGIGKSCAIFLAKEGCNLILNGRKEERLTQLKKEIEDKYYVNVKTLVFDVRDYENAKKEIESLEDNWKNIDILINNAGLALGLEKIYENSMEDTWTMIDTNIKGLINVTNLVIPMMLKRDVTGSIINIGSIAGDMAYAGGTMYCATKAAVKTLSDGLRIELVDTKIKVTDVKPGLVETNFSVTRFKGDKDRADAVYKGVEPLTPNDVAETVVYICNLPENVHIGEISMLCNKQADGRTVHRTK